MNEHKGLSDGSKAFIDRMNEYYKEIVETDELAELNKYVPLGSEWEKYMMRTTKKELVSLLKGTLTTLQKYRKNFESTGGNSIAFECGKSP